MLHSVRVGHDPVMVMVRVETDLAIRSLFGWTIFLASKGSSAV